MAEEAQEAMDQEQSQAAEESHPSENAAAEDGAPEQQGPEPAIDESAADPLGGGEGGGLGDLMDIFAEEDSDPESTAGLFSEFLEELTMDQVADSADRLLEEFRAI